MVVGEVEVIVVAVIVEVIIEVVVVVVLKADELQVVEEKELIVL